MTKTLMTTVAIALSSGFAGSLLQKYVAPPAAFAQNQPLERLAPKEIRAQHFTIVDRSGNSIASFEYDPGSSVRYRYLQPRIVLRDADGRILWSSRGLGIEPLSER